MAMIRGREAATSSLAEPYLTDLLRREIRARLYPLD
jgi:hypothetical protein